MCAGTNLACEKCSVYGFSHYFMLSDITNFIFSYAYYLIIPSHIFTEYALEIKKKFRKS